MHRRPRVVAALAVLILLTGTLADGDETPVSPSCLDEASGEAVLFAPRGDGDWCSVDDLPGPTRCEMEGHEPLDIDPDTGGHCIQPLPARTVVLEGPAGWGGRLEWRREDPDATAKLASREARTEGTAAKVPVARVDRVLRLLRAGSSPVSFFLPGSEPEPVRTVPQPQTGGEIYVALPHRRLVPERLELCRGDRTIALFPEAVQGRYALPGVRPGSYQLVPGWRGGIRGEAIPVTVAAEETTELLPLPLPPVGAVEILIGEELCTEEDTFPRRLELSGLTLTQGAIQKSADPLWQTEVDPGACDFWLEGVPPGSYQVVLARYTLAERELLAWADLTVEEDGLTTIALDRGDTSVHGVVKYSDGEPFVHGWVVFSQGTREIETELDALGRYEIQLPAPGTYQVAVTFPRYYPLVTREVRLPTSAGRLDFEITGGSIDLSIRREDGAEIDEIVQFSISAVGGGPAFGKSGFLRPQEIEDAHLDQLPFDQRLRVTAATRSGWVAEPPGEVELSEDAPRQPVDLLLRKIEYRIRVVDETGTPVRGAEVQLGIVALVEEAPGEFRGPLGAPGTMLRVVPPAGLSPYCRTIDSNPDQVVELAAAPFPAEVWLEGNPTPPRVAIEGLPGSDCAFWVSPPFYPAEQVGERVRLTLPSLPLGTFLVRTAGGESGLLEVPGGPPLVLRTPAAPEP
jgi:hypothetical protein